MKYQASKLRYNVTVKEEKMIWTFRITCEYGPCLDDDWVREVEISSNNTLHGMHLAIQTIIGFDNDHLYDFFGGRRSSNRRIIFTEDDRWEVREDVFYSTVLEEIYPLPKDIKLYYIFDYGDYWTFRIVKTRKKPKEKEANVEYPRVIKEVGENPSQYGY